MSVVPTSEPDTTVAVSSTEFLATVAARELAGKGRVFAGVGLPTLAVDLAKRTVNSYLELVYESGVCGAHPEGLAEGIADSVLVSGAESVVSLQALFGYVLQGGNVDVGFLGAAQVDRHGGLSTSFIGDWRKPKVRLPGSGGAADIMPNAGECIVVLRRHDHGAPFRLRLTSAPLPARCALVPPIRRPCPPGTASRR
jgi:glutaconate CoA-transferase subunit B